MYIYIYIYVYIIYNTYYIYVYYICHLQMPKYMDKKARHLFKQKLYFGFFKTFKDYIKSM